MYKLFTTEVKERIQSTENYPVIDLDWNVDGTACLLVKTETGKYYTEKLSYSDMKLSLEELSRTIINRVNNNKN